MRARLAKSRGKGKCGSSQSDWLRHGFPAGRYPSKATGMNQPSFLAASLYVALGGGAGAWLRYAAGRLIPAGTFPYATLSVNIAGSFAMGLLAGWLARQGGGEGIRLLLGVGLLGGFTTFSAFSLEMIGLIQRGAWGGAALYAALSLVGGVAGLWAGLSMMRVAA